jgi:butyryl-CoA dehydrogenase
MTDLNGHLTDIRSWARDFAENEVAPRAAEMDRTGRYDTSVIDEMFAAGMMGMLVPSEYGGRGSGALEYITVVEELARADASTALVMSIHNSLVVALLTEFASDEVKARVLPSLAKNKVGAFALTELDPASPTRATERGGSFFVDGTKMYITNGPVADVIVLFAATGEVEVERHGKRVKRDEFSALLIEDAEAKGLRRENIGGRLGLTAAPVGRLEFEGLPVPVGNVIGERGAGYKMAMRVLDGGRIGAAAMAVGVAQAAVEAARRYATSRILQGKAISSFQGIQFIIAEIVTKLSAARALTYEAAREMDKGAPITKIAAQAKLFASETASFVASKALQIHGGSGVVRDLHPVERLFRDARVMEIIEGTSEIQKLIVAGCELKG